jgi:Flp pilus assembly protein TadB
MMTPLVEALSRARVRQPSRTAQFISAAVDVCVRRIESGASADEEVSATVAFVLRGLSLHSD